MTVRTWFTISIVVVIALFAAVALKLSAPVNAPSIVARVGETRLAGHLVASCWPGGNGKIACKQGKGDGNGAVATIPPKGTLRVIVAYPLQPKDGYLQFSRKTGPLYRTPWRENTHYDLPPGRYTLNAVAQYPKGPHVEYSFDFRVR